MPFENSTVTQNLLNQEDKKIAILFESLPTPPKTKKIAIRHDLNFSQFFYMSYKYFLIDFHLIRHKFMHMNSTRSVFLPLSMINFISFTCFIVGRLVVT